MTFAFLISQIIFLIVIFLIFSFQIQTDSISANFHNLQHLFFIANKLINDVVKSPPPPIPVDDTKCTKFSSDGGFLRQPCLDSFSGNVGCPTVIVDMIAWEKFSHLLSSIMWPFILKCLVEGKEFIDSKIHQVQLLKDFQILLCYFYN